MVPIAVRNSFGVIVEHRSSVRVDGDETTSELNGLSVTNINSRARLGAGREGPFILKWRTRSHNAQNAQNYRHYESIIK
jgi:hypothetical protein